MTVADGYTLTIHDIFSVVTRDGADSLAILQIKSSKESLKFYSTNDFVFFFKFLFVIFFVYVTRTTHITVENVYISFD